MKAGLFATALAAGIALGAPMSAKAESWPARPVTMVVPFPAGGPTDALARAVAQELSTKLGQQFVVENRSGAAGNIGAASVAKAAPDGYTILFGTPGPLATNKLTYKQMNFDPETFAPIVLIAKSPLIIATNPNFPAKTLKDLVAHAKANPGKINVGTPGNGTLGHLSLLLVESHAGVQLMNVPYKGTAPLTNDLLGDQIDVAMDFMSTYVPLVQANKLRALAVTSATRADQLPDTATAQETGMKDFEATAWYALVAPAGTPAEITDKINKVTNSYIASAEGKDLMVKLGMQPSGGKPADLKTFISAELAKWGPIIKAANISF